jgi:uncharacterized protein (TIGR03435 family)
LRSLLNSNHGFINTTRDMFSSNEPVPRLMQYAFDAPAQGISGSPAWAESMRYQIDAKIDEDTMAALDKLPSEERSERWRAMLIAVLVDRFGLKYHHEIKVLPVYELVLVKNGATGDAKLKQSSATKSSTTTHNSTLHGTVTLSDLATALSRIVGRLTLDKTNLAGRFNVQLTWSNENSRAQDDTAPSIFTALKEQLGLKLVSTKAPVDTIVIDALTKPTLD